LCLGALTTSVSTKNDTKPNFTSSILLIPIGLYYLGLKSLKLSCTRAFSFYYWALKISLTLSANVLNDSLRCAYLNGQFAI
jgi:hypothetical protein